jgi:hypothetical protein
MLTTRLRTSRSTSIRRTYRDVPEGSLRILYFLSGPRTKAIDDVGFRIGTAFYRASSLWQHIIQVSM